MSGVHRKCIVCGATLPMVGVFCGGCLRAWMNTEPPPRASNRSGKRLWVDRVREAWADACAMDEALKPKQERPDNHETMRRIWRDWTIWTPADDAAFNVGYRRWREGARL